MYINYVSYLFTDHTYTTESPFLITLMNVSEEGKAETKMMKHKEMEV